MHMEDHLTRMFMIIVLFLTWPYAYEYLVNHGNIWMKKKPDNQHPSLAYQG